MFTALKAITTIVTYLIIVHFIRCLGLTGNGCGIIK